MPFKDLRKIKPEIHDVNDWRGRPDPNFHGSGPIDLSANIKRVGNTNQDPALLDLYQKGPLKSVGWDKVCGQCLTPETEIMTENGLTPIKNVKVGDLVLTHKGRFRKVIQTFVREYHGKIRRIRVAGNPSFVALTQDHRILARRLAYSGGRHAPLRLLAMDWVQAKDFEVRSSVTTQWTPTYPRINEVIAIDASAHLEVGNLSLDKDLMKVIGYWLAEGHLIRRGKYGAVGIGFSFGKSLREYAYAKDAADSLTNLGFRPFLWLGNDGLWHLKVNSVKLGQIMNQFGQSASTKKLPMWIKLLPTTHLDVLLHSYLAGDGTEYRPSCYSASSVSRTLIFDLRDIGLKIGYTVQIFKGMKAGTMRILGRLVNVKESLQIRFNDRKAQGRNVMRADADYLYPRLKEIQDFDYDGPVYNLEVADDNSYCTALFATHNCIYFYRDNNLKNRRHGRCRAYGFKEVHEELTAEVKQNYTEPDGQFTFGEWPGCPTWTSRERLSRG